MYTAEESFRKFASLKPYASLISIKVIIIKKVESGQGTTLSLSSENDNLGNVYLFSELLSTKLPLNVILMEIAYELYSRGGEFSLQWIPREQNGEVYKLSNFVTRRFAIDKEMKGGLVRLPLYLLTKLIEEGQDFYWDFESRKKRSGKLRKPLTEDITQEVECVAPTLNPKRLKTSRLESTRPW